MSTTQISRSWLFAIALLLVAGMAFPACDTPPEDEEEETDEIVLGVNFTRLFAEPTQTERDQVKADWAARRTESSGTPKTPGSATYDGAFHAILQHTVTSTGQADVTHFGVIRIPEGGTNLPVLVIHHGSDKGIHLNMTEAEPVTASANQGVAEWVAAFPQLAASTVQIWPAYRSETITTTGTPVAGGPFTASGDPSPWDYDVDDSIAFLDAALNRWDAETDETRIVAMGMSRGGNTALLHAIRDNRIQAVTNYYGPADAFNDGADLFARGALLGIPEILSTTGVQYLFDTVFSPLRNEDETYNAGADYASARLELVRRSASVFTDDLPDTQVHHHYGDAVVPFAFSEAFKDAVETSGTPSIFEFNAYGTEADARSPVFHAPELTPDMQPSLAKTETFLLNALGLGTATRSEVAY